jgi:hypothetical protein
VQRPEPRRTGRRNAPAYGPQPPRPDSYGPDPPEPDPYGSYWYEPPPDPYGTQPGYGSGDPTRLTGTAPQPEPRPEPRPGPWPDPWPGQGSNGPVNAGPGPNGGRLKRQRGRGRIRRFFRLRTVRVILALIAVFLCWVGFSVGQALAAPGGGSTAAKLAEWARDHYLGPVVTFGEWISYNPPKTGG